MVSSKVKISSSNPKNFEDILDKTDMNKIKGRIYSQTNNNLHSTMAVPRGNMRISVTEQQVTNGGFGLFQLLILSILLSLDFPSAWIGLIPIFIGRAPDYWECNGVVVDANNTCNCNGTLSAPYPFTSIVGEWSLVCSTSWASDFITSIQMVGCLVGALLSSQIADWYGRRYATFGLCFVFALGSCVSAVAPDPYVFTAARFLCGAGSAGMQGLTSVYAMEFMPMSWRTLPYSLRPYGEATIIFGLLGYYFRHWRTLVWVTTSSILTVMLIIPILPESPRWLMQRQKIEDAHKIINRIARMNGRPPIEIEVIQEIVESEMGGNSSEKLAKASYGLIFKNKKLRLTALCLMMIWFSWALVTFGLAYNIKNVPGDRYLNVVYLGIADSIGYPATLLIINRFGRRLSVVVSMSFGATFLVSLAATYFIVDVTSYTTLVVMLYLLGKFGLAVTRTALRCLTAESFPTAVRSMGGGLCGIAISVGAIICPQLAYFGSKNPSIPLLVFAFISVLGSLFAFCMTETEGKPLQDSVARKLSRKISIISQNGQKEPANPTIGCQ